MDFDPKTVCLADDSELLLHALCIRSEVDLVMCVLHCSHRAALKWLKPLRDPLRDDYGYLLKALHIDSAVDLVMCVLHCSEFEAIQWLRGTEVSCRICR